MRRRPERSAIEAHVEEEQAKHTSRSHLEHWLDRRKPLVDGQKLDRELPASSTASLLRSFGSGSYYGLCTWNLASLQEHASG